MQVAREYLASVRRGFRGHALLQVNARLHSICRSTPSLGYCPINLGLVFLPRLTLGHRFSAGLPYLSGQRFDCLPVRHVLNVGAFSAAGIAKMWVVFPRANFVRYAASPAPEIDAFRLIAVRTEVNEKRQIIDDRGVLPPGQLPHQTTRPAAI